MNPLNPLYAIATLVSAFAAAYCLRNRVALGDVAGRFSSIDGLRGYLALGVFVHHAAIWFFYLRGGAFGEMPSNLYNNLGKASVSVFFMITGLLFYAKILESDSKPLVWTRLFVSRLLRLGPLYVVTVLVGVVVIAYLSGFHLNVSAKKVVQEIVQWGSFTMLGSPDINGHSDTQPLLGPTWSLRYEWFFYLLLPTFAVISGRRAPLMLVLIGLGTCALALLLKHPLMPALSFVGGIVAAKLATGGYGVKRFAVTPTASAIVLACFAYALLGFAAPFTLAQGVVLTVAFCLIACGNTLFGILGWKTSRVLGEITYSMYLLHSLLLFGVFQLLIGPAQSADFAPFTHWLVVIASAQLLVAVSIISFLLIESPSMRRVDDVTRWLSARGNRNRDRPPSVPA